MERIIKLAMEKKRAVISLLVLIIVSGVFSRLSIPVESEPEIDIPIVYVGISHDGISPEDCQRLIVKPTENELRSIEGLKELKGIANEGYATLVLEFDVGFNKEKVVNDVREKVDGIKNKFPKNTNEPIIQEVSVGDFPTLIINIAGNNVQERALYLIAKDLKEKIESFKSILEVKLEGSREEVLEALINPEQIESYEITTQELINAITLNNKMIPAGAIQSETGLFSVKVPGLVTKKEDIYNLPIRAYDNGVIKLSDIANIKRTFKDKETYTRVNGESAVSITVKKRGGENFIKTVDEVQNYVNNYIKKFSSNISIQYSFDQAPYMKQQIAELEGNIMTAITIVIIIVVSVLGFRSAILVGFAIPVTILLTFNILVLLGISYNFMVMFGMLIAVGMLIDGSIVIVEFADRKIAEGFNREEAYTLAVKRMFWPVLASTTTTLAVFFPLIFWPGVAGQFMGILPKTILIVLSASLLYAIIFVPVLGSTFAKEKVGLEKVSSTKGKDLEKYNEVLQLQNFTGSYARTVNKLISAPMKTILIVGIIVPSIFIGFSLYGKGVEFFTNTEIKWAYAKIRARGNLSPAEMRDISTEVENIILTNQQIESTFLRTGFSSLRGQSAGESSDDLIGTIYFELKDKKYRTENINGEKILTQIRSQVIKVPGVLIEINRIREGPPVGKDIQIEVSSNNHELLIPAVKIVRKHMENNVESIIDIEDSTPLPKIDWILRVDREKAAIFGADINTIGRTINLITNGILIGEYRPNDSSEEIEVRVRYPVENRKINELDELRINTEKGIVPLSNFVKLEAAHSIQSLTRINSRNVMYIRANTKEGTLPIQIVDELENWINSNINDDRIDFKFKGEDEERKESQTYLTKAFMFALFLMFILLITQFNRFYQALLIMSAVILSTAGVLLGITIFGQTFSIIMTGTGIIALAGIVVNNNIVLIDSYNYIRKNTTNSIKESIVIASAQRLRPVLLTTITTVCGLLPLALHISINLLARDVTFGSPVTSWWVQIAGTIVYGLIFSSILTLILTPVLLSLPEMLKNNFKKLTNFIQKTPA